MATTAVAPRLLASAASVLLGLTLTLGTTALAQAQAPAWDKAAWLKKLEEAKKAEGDRMIQYDAQPNYANW